MSTEQKAGLTIKVFDINAPSESAFASDLRVISEKVSKQALILYFGRDEFSDNSKYLFLHAAAQTDGHRHVWCTFNRKLVRDLRDGGVEAFDLSENVNQTVRLLLRARVAVFCVNPSESLKSRLLLAALAGAIKVQLWHGIGVKRMEMQNIEHKNMLDLAAVARMRWAAEIDCIVSPSQPFDQHWQETFGVGRVIRAGYPRNEVLLREATKLERLNVPQGLVKDTPKKKILIVPTWGTAGDSHWSKCTRTMSEIARKFDLELYVKPHPYEAAALSKAPVSGDGALTVLPANMDLYPLLNRFSCMITDHSSMAFDAFLLDMAIVFLEPNDRRFYMTEMLQPPVGPTIAGFAELTKLPALLEAAQACAENRRNAARKYFETPPLVACQTIHAAILQLAEAA